MAFWNNLFFFLIFFSIRSLIMYYQPEYQITLYCFISNVAMSIQQCLCKCIIATLTACWIWSLDSSLDLHITIPYLFQIIVITFCCVKGILPIICKTMFCCGQCEGMLFGAERKSQVYAHLHEVLLKREMKDIGMYRKDVFSWGKKMFSDTGCQVPIFSYFLARLLFSPIFSWNP